MKKLLLILPVVALAACNQEPVQPNEFVAGCETVIQSKVGGSLYKCPKTEELAAIQAMEANTMFTSISEDEFDVEAVANDKEHVYVNLTTFNNCEEGQLQYRVLVNNPVFDGKTYYAVQVCR